MSKITYTLNQSPERNQRSDIAERRLKVWNATNTVRAVVTEIYPEDEPRAVYEPGENTLNTNDTAAKQPVPRETSQQVGDLVANHESPADLAKQQAIDAARQSINEVHGEV